MRACEAWVFLKEAGLTSRGHGPWPSRSAVVSGSRFLEEIYPIKRDRARNLPSDQRTGSRQASRAALRRSARSLRRSGNGAGREASTSAPPRGRRSIRDRWSWPEVVPPSRTAHRPTPSRTAVLKLPLGGIDSGPLPRAPSRKDRGHAAKLRSARRSPAPRSTSSSLPSRSSMGTSSATAILRSVPARGKPVFPLSIW